MRDSEGRAVIPEPQSLRNKIRSEVSQMLAHYKTAPDEPQELTRYSTKGTQPSQGLRLAGAEAIGAKARV
jgi:hypothetical protein